MKLLKDLKKIIQANLTFPDLKDLHIRQIKLYDQYINFLIYRDRKNNLSDGSLTNSHANTKNLERKRPLSIDP